MFMERNKNMLNCSFMHTNGVLWLQMFLEVLELWKYFIF